MALLLALIVLLLVEAMTTGIVVLASRARAVADSQIRRTRAEAASDFAVASALAGWAGSGPDTIAPGNVVALTAPASEADVRTTLAVERVTPALSIVRGYASVGGALAYANARTTAIARTLDRRQLIAESNGAVISGGLVVVAGGTSLTAAEGFLPEGWTSSVCPATDILPPPDALASSSPAMIGDAAAVSGSVVVDSTLAATDSIALGGVKWSELQSIADRIESGTVTPAPVDSTGECAINAAGNWGDPRGLAAPCGNDFPLIYSKGDLVMAGGTGQGILAVDGVFTMSASARFTGLIVARGGVSIEPGAHITGALRVRSGYTLIEDAAIDASRCAVARAAFSTPSAHRAILSQRRFIPSF